MPLIVRMSDDAGLATLLAGEGLVSAAAAKAPVTDLATWEWPLAQYGANYYEQIGLTQEDRTRFSPIDRPVKSPVRVVAPMSVKRGSFISRVRARGPPPSTRSIL